ncbi:hypothetical protein OUZ56_029248 [Daphnia magna]|uniref:4-coumarate--CoA ligase n=1 Tax=Daphnia magna TaxID=35525 RepID=A0ABR0B694_9CRUS|nr:hypothetical protein OUZ56_029248 [Daphnia magna]
MAWRSSLQRAALLANKRATLTAVVNHQQVALSNLVSPARETQPSAAGDVAINSRIETNMVSSRHSDCPLHGMTMVHRFFDNVSRYSKQIALECGITGRKYTYEMLAHLIRRYGSALTRAGFKKGQVMAIVSPNVPEFAIALLGASAIGMPVALVNPTFTPAEIARQLSTVGATAVFGVAPMAELLKQVAQLCPSVRRVILLGPPQEGFVCFQEMLQDSGDLFNENVDIDVMNDTFVLPHSSGTTGVPKNVMLTHFNVGSNVTQNIHPGTSRNQLATDQYQETHICLLPFFHSYGVNGIMMIGFDLGARLVTLPRFDAASYLKAIDDYKPTLLHIVPTLAYLFIKHPALKMDGFERLHTIFCAASPLGEKTATQLQEKFNRPDLLIQQGYGLTETSPGVAQTPLNNDTFGSCGRLISRTKAKVIDLEDGVTTLGPNQQGELYLAGPQIMKGYYNEPEATKEMISEDGWLRTGDVAYYDEEGNFYIVDRLKELIKVKGFQVAPAELEDILGTHPAIAEAAVIGIPDEHAGELPRAYVVKKAGMESVSDAEIRSFVDTKVSSHKQIKGGVQFCDALPKNNMGKVLRRELRAQFSQSK